MKKILGFVCALVMMLSMLTTAYASNYVVSPEHDGDTTPSSPQTGYEFNLGTVGGIALAGGVVAYVSVRKLRKQA